MRELLHADVKDIKTESTESYRDIKPKKEMSTKELNHAVSDEINKAAKEAEIQDQAENVEGKGLSEEEKKQIKKETNWSDDIIDHIGSMDQYEIYKNAVLHEAEIDGRKCLIKDIDFDYVDPKTGMTNRELMEEGRSPVDAKTGEKIELHHMDQDAEAPFAELCENSEHGDGHHSTLHPKTDESWRKDSVLDARYNNTEKPNHWKERAGEV